LGKMKRERQNHGVALQSGHEGANCFCRRVGLFQAVRNSKRFIRNNASKRRVQWKDASAKNKLVKSKQNRWGGKRNDFDCA